MNRKRTCTGILKYRDPGKGSGRKTERLRWLTLLRTNVDDLVIDNVFIVIWSLNLGERIWNRWVHGNWSKAREETAPQEKVCTLLSQRERERERERGIFIKQTKNFQYSVTASLFSTKLKLLHSYYNTKDDYSSYLKIRIVS